ncbi:hypothetical protein ACNF42_02095 [Cuniculiplasma sp. SKW3]|uniref:hypothetical protein n=1 Tax=unclassified Cuniculiplasma TaxID=2619706 RepID=UPI003FD1E7C5
MDISSILSNPLVELALIFVDGLLFGLGIKKGVWSVILIVLAVLLGEYINYSVLPKASLQTFENNVVSHITNVLHNIEQVIPFHDLGAISISLILFIVGFVIGYLKG